MSKCMLLYVKMHVIICTSAVLCYEFSHSSFSLKLQSADLSYFTFIVTLRGDNLQRLFVTVSLSNIPNMLEIKGMSKSGRNIII